VDSPSTVESPRLQLSDLTPGQKLSGKVTRIELFGAFLDVGAATDGLAHISMLSPNKVNRTEDILQVGQVVDCWVHAVDAVGSRLELTLIRPVSLPWKDVRPGLRLAGKVVRLEKFGAFVDVGAERPGLVHVSEMANDYVSNPGDIVKVGDEVQVTVLELDRTKRQIRLSMKAAAVQEVEPVAEEDEKVPTAMEFALRQAMGQAAPDEAARPAAAPRPAPRPRSSQDDILARTLKQRIK
jgi:ribosomal protein S1